MNEIIFICRTVDDPNDPEFDVTAVSDVDSEEAEASAEVDENGDEIVVVAPDGGDAPASADGVEEGMKLNRHGFFFDCNHFCYR